jgi:hypothetical protein
VDRRQRQMCIRDSPKTPKEEKCDGVDSGGIINKIYLLRTATPQLKIAQRLTAKPKQAVLTKQTDTKICLE